MVTPTQYAVTVATTGIVVFLPITLWIFEGDGLMVGASLFVGAVGWVGMFLAARQLYREQQAT